LALIVDETTDASSRSVLNIIAVITTVIEYGIAYNDIRFLMSDNARYMRKCAQEILSPLFPNMIHGTCWAHIISLVGSRWVDIFEDVNSFVADFKLIFLRTPARKRRYQTYLSRLGKTCKLPPEPVLARWNSWFEAVNYHAEYFPCYSIFIQEEIDESFTHGSQALRRLSSTLEEPNASKLLACIKFISKSTERLVMLLKMLEGRESFAVFIFNTMQDLHASLLAGSRK
jgi:hypothetical protein